MRLRYEFLRMQETTIETREADGTELDLSVLTLTILAHPQIERLGQQHALRGPGPFSISRNEPLFADPGEEGEALLDPHVSRKAVELRRDGEALLVTSENRKARLEGEPLGLVHKLVEPEALERGVVLTLGRYVALLLRRAEPLERAGELGMVGPSPELQRVRVRVRQFARGHQPVLINGPTGTGKELVARAIHDQSPRADQPWVALNLAAVPASTAASQLFGHARGAFTGATGSSTGLFGAAAGGSLFLDELGEAPIELQPLLLRALESGEIQVVGGKVREVDVRVITATDADLDVAVRDGLLRPALYHRLAGSTILLPPLRDRREDVAAQLRHFLGQQVRELGRSERLDDPKWVPPEVQLALICHPWPGNTRQLRRIVEAMLLVGLDRDQLQLPEGFANSGDSTPQSTSPQSSVSSSSQSTGSRREGGSTESLEAETLAAALADNGYRLKPSAAQLGVAVNTLKALMKRHGFRRAKELVARDIEAARARVGDDLPRLATELRVSSHALRLRLRELEISLG